MLNLTGDQLARKRISSAASESNLGTLFISYEQKSFHKTKRSHQSSRVIIRFCVVVAVIIIIMNSTSSSVLQQINQVVRTSQSGVLGGRRVFRYDEEEHDLLQDDEWVLSMNLWPGTSLSEDHHRSMKRPDSSFARIA